MALHQADLLAALVELIHHFHRGLGDRAHGDDDLGGLGVAVVDERGIGPAGEAGGFLEVLLDDFDDVVEVGVLGLAGLEVDIVVLGPTAGDGVGVRVEGTGAEFLDLVHREQLLPLLLIDELDVLDLVGGAEPIEEMEDRHAGLEGDQVGDRGKIGDLLNRAGADHGDAGLPDGVDVLVVAEDGQSAGGKRPSGDVKDRREQFADPLVDVRDHQ